MSPAPCRPDPTIAALIRAGAATLVLPGAVTEVRIMSHTRRGTIVGYFDDPDALVREVVPWDGQHSVYLTPNPVRPNLLARARNHLVERARVATADRDILRRAWFLTDFDPVRPAGIAATDAERDQALARRDEAVAWLRTLGFPDPFLAMSGNGGHALWRVDLANDEGIGAVYAQALRALGARFTDNLVRFDETVHNAARIWKAYGTIAVKGDPTEDRPYRRAEIAAPAAVALVSRSTLEALAAQAPSSPGSYKGPSASRPPRRHQLDVLAAFRATGRYLRDLGGGKHAVTCLWVDEHSGNSGVSETVLFVRDDPSRPFGFKCQHGHCTDRSISDVYAFLRAEAGCTTTARASAPQPEPWPTLHPAAYHGLLGRIVRAIAPHTEADPVAILGHLLPAIGNAIGSRPHVQVQHDRHPLRFYVACVGRTAKGRKGTAWSTPRHMLKTIDPTWAAERVKAGLSSGEGLIYHVRDARSEEQPIKQRGQVIGYHMVRVDAGVTDKRLLVVEPEFAAVLRRMEREASSLSPVLREAWDIGVDGVLSTLTKHAPIQATGAHLSIVAHVTVEEVQRFLTATEQVNGFANRFLWILTRRSQILPRGGAVPDAMLTPLTEELRGAVQWATGVEDVRRDDEAEALWALVYPALSEGEEGLIGGILARAEAQVIRVAALYAVLDRSCVVRSAHLRAALALWDYAAASARLIFAGRIGVPLADTLWAEIQRVGEISRTDLWAALGRHARGIDFDHALGVLRLRGLVESFEKPTKGRPVEFWRKRVCEEAKEAKEA